MGSGLGSVRFMYRDRHCARTVCGVRHACHMESQPSRVSAPRGICPRSMIAHLSCMSCRLTTHFTLPPKISKSLALSIDDRNTQSEWTFTYKGTCIVVALKHDRPERLKPPRNASQETSAPMSATSGIPPAARLKDDNAKKASTGKSICLKQAAGAPGAPLDNLASTSVGKRDPGGGSPLGWVSWIFWYLQKCHVNDSLVHTWHSIILGFSGQSTLHAVQCIFCQEQKCKDRDRLTIRQAPHVRC